MSKLSDFSDEFIAKLKNAGGNLYRDFVAELNSLPVFKPITPKPARKARLNRPSITISKKKIKEVERVNKRIDEKVNKIQKEKEEINQMRDELNADYNKLAQEYFVVVDFTFRTIYVSKSGKVYYGPEQKETIDINFKSTEGKVTQADVKPYILDELAQRSHEYMYDELISIDEIKIIPMEDVKKHANVQIKDELMKGAHIGFSWVPDVKFEDNDMCVYDALCSLKRAPKIFQKKEKLLKYFQERENNDAYFVGRDSRQLSLTSGVSPKMMQALCEEYDVTHYALDIEEKRLFTHISNARNYDPICYISHDNHMYLITDKKFVNKLSQSRSNIDCNYVVQMCRKEIEEKEIKETIFENIEVGKLPEYKDCVIIYNQGENKTSLDKLMMDIFEKERVIYRQKITNNKVVIIEYKNNVLLMVDPSLPFHLKIKDSDNEIDYKIVKEVCQKYKIPFKNQSISAVIQIIAMNKLDEHSKRIQISKEDKQTVLKRQDNKCNKCKLTAKYYEYDHVIPLASNGTNELDNIQALCVQCHFEKSKNEQDNGDYFSLPAHASTFNNKGREVVLSKAFNRYAFIERLEASAKKHKIFYIDLNKCRRNILLHLKQNDVKIPVFTCMDEPRYFEIGKDKIETGFYFIESKNYFPTR